ncbi:VOC family protein [Kaarinaea lacus]
MSGPARAGLFVYAKDSERLARFYESVAGMSRIHKTDELIVLQSQDIQLLVHKMPEQIAKDIVISTPPEKRENTALKFFFTVPNLTEARSIASSLGGEIFNENWSGPGFIVCNAIDPEGNVFQVREFGI